MADPERHRRPPTNGTQFHRKVSASEVGGGGAASAPLQRVPILSFSHTFLPKSAHVGGQRPQTGRRPPTGNPGSAAIHFLLYYNKVLRVQQNDKLGLSHTLPSSVQQGNRC